METQRLDVLADRFGARIHEWGQPRDRERQGTKQGRLDKLWRAVGRGPCVSLPKSTDVGVLASDRDVGTEEVRPSRIK